MTASKLVTSPSEGHGLTSNITDRLYHALVTGQKTETIVAVVVFEAVGTGQRKTKQGTHRHVQFEAVRLEPVHDANQANELRYLAQGLYEQRTSTGEHRPLPLGLGGDEEKRLALIERIEEWATGKGMTGADLESAWREHFGAAQDADWSFGDQGVPGDYRKATVAHLLSFGYSTGALDLEAKLPHEDRDDEDDDASDEGEETEPGVTCQVCATKSTRLTDGLCDACAKNAGIPVDATDDDEQSAAG